MSMLEGFARQLEALHVELTELRARLTDVEAAVTAKPAKIEVPGSPASPVKSSVITPSGSKPAGK